MVLSDAEIKVLYADETGFILDESPAALLDFARAIEAEARRDALEEAAKMCESQWSNAAEKLYGIECAAAIRKLKEDTQ